MQKKIPGRMLLKVVGIILIILGVMGVLSAVSTIMMAGSISSGQMAQEMLDILEQTAGPLGVDPGYLMSAGIISAVNSAVYMILGIFGILYSKRPDKGKRSFIFGIVLIVLALAVQAHNAVYGVMTVMNLIIALVFPLLYTWGGYRNMQAYEGTKTETDSGQDTRMEK